MYLFWATPEKLCSVCFVCLRQCLCPKDVVQLQNSKLRTAAEAHLMHCADVYHWCVPPGLWGNDPSGFYGQRLPCGVLPLWGEARAQLSFFHLDPFTQCIVAKPHLNGIVKLLMSLNSILKSIVKWRWKIYNLTNTPSCLQECEMCSSPNTCKHTHHI